ncbi:MAG: hypothetical protein AVDCRST_MAG25-1232, partial [uncultured Rubrobacteraceae bacterium]
GPNGVCLWSKPCVLERIRPPPLEDAGPFLLLQRTTVYRRGRSSGDV